MKTKQLPPEQRFQDYQSRYSTMISLIELFFPEYTSFSDEEVKKRLKDTRKIYVSLKKEKDPLADYFVLKYRYLINSCDENKKYLPVHRGFKEGDYRKYESLKKILTKEPRSIDFLNIALFLATSEKVSADSIAALFTASLYRDEYSAVILPEIRKTLLDFQTYNNNLIKNIESNPIEKETDLSFYPSFGFFPIPITNTTYRARNEELTRRTNIKQRLKEYIAVVCNEAPKNIAKDVYLEKFLLNHLSQKGLNAISSNLANTEEHRHIAKP